jgi:hypothetical protein
VHRHADGAIDAATTKKYRCHGVSMQLIQARMRFVLKREPRCDELGAQLPDGSILTAVVTLRRRADALGHLIGRFQILAPSTTRVLYAGTIELMERVGSHHEPFGPNGGACEACDQKAHLEGWLFGCGTGHNTQTRLRANVTLNRALNVVSTKLSGSIDGMLLRP